MTVQGSAEPVHDSMAVKVPSKTKFLYSIGAFGTQFFNGVQAAATFWFWRSSGRVDPVSYTIIMVILYNIWNAVNDPVFGWLSDKTQSRWGRRIPYIRFFTPIWFISMIFLFFPYLSLGQLGMAIWLAVFIIIFDGCYTFVAGCYNSLMPELTSITTERTNINTITQIFALLGTGISFVFPLLLAEKELSLFIFIIIGGIVALLVLFIPSFFLKERKSLTSEPPLGLFDAVKYSIKNRPFMSFVGWNFMGQFAISTILLIAIDYAQNVLGAGDLEKYLIFGALFLTLLPGFFIARAMANKKGVKFTVMLSTFIVATGLLILFFAEVTWMAIVSLSVAGFGLAGVMIFAYVMIAEATDYDELTTHQRREAMFFGTNALLTKPAIGMAHGVATWTLALVVSSSLAHRMVIGLFPSIALFISLIFLFFYPKKGETDEMKKQLSLFHQKLETEVEL